MRYRLVPSNYMENPILREFDSSEVSEDELIKYNEQGYNIFYFPNHNSKPLPNSVGYLRGKFIDDYSWIFVDMDLKDGVYTDLEHFGQTLLEKVPVKPTKTIKSGNGCHAYWKIKDLTRETYLSLQKRLITLLSTDDSIWTLLQPMRLEGFKNVKVKGSEVLCEVVNHPDLTTGNDYSVADFDFLPQIKEVDSEKIQKHLDKVDGKVVRKFTSVDLSELPEKFVTLLEKNEQINEWFTNPDDRSVCDMKIANSLKMMRFSEEEAFQILAQTSKGQERGIEYVESTLSLAFDKPLQIFDDLYKELDKIINSVDVVKSLDDENREYEITKKNEQIKIQKKFDRKRGKFSIKNDRKKRAEEYLDYVKLMINYSGKSLPLFGKKFSGLINFIPIDTVFIGGESGRGKSTTVSTIAGNNLLLGKKVCVLSTEEKKEQHLDRIIGAMIDRDFSQYKKWTDMERMRVAKEYTDRYIDQLVVIDYLYETSDGVESNLNAVEGFENTLNGLATEGFDLIIIDYWTKINESVDFPKREGWKNLDESAKIIEEFNKRHKIPIVAFGQLMEGSEGKMFKDRIEGRKSIYNYVTIALEMLTDFESKVTTFIPRKLRFGSENLGKDFNFKYNRGKYDEL